MNLYEKFKTAKLNNVYITYNYVEIYKISKIQCFL